MNTKSDAPKEKTAQSGQAIYVIVWCLAGLLIPRAVIYGEMAPFGVSLAAAIEGATVPVTLSLTLGYLLAGGVPFPLRYIAAVAIVAGTRWVLAAIPAVRDKPVVVPVVTFTAVLSTGLAMFSRFGLDGYRVLLLVTEAMVAAGCALFFRMTVRWSAAPGDLTPTRQAAVVLTGGVTIMALSTLTVGAFSPGRAFAILLTLLLARSGQEAGGCVAGVVIGAAVALATPGQLIPALSLMFGGLIGGLFSRFGKAAEAIAYFMAAGIITLMEADEQALIHCYEIVAAGIVFVLIPRKWDPFLQHLFLRSRELPAVEGFRRAAVLRLEIAAQSLGEVGETVTAVSDKLRRYGAPDDAALARSCRQTVCDPCPMRLVCWQQHAEETRAAFAALAPWLRQNDGRPGHALPGRLREECRRPEQLTDAVCRAYTQYAAQQTAWERLRELQAAVQELFGGMSRLLSGLAADLQDPRQVDVELSGRVQNVCADFGIPIRDALCSRDRNNRLSVEMLLGDVGVRLDEGRWFRDMQRACGREFAAPTVVEYGEHLRVTLTEQPRYAIESGFSQLCCGGEKLCGDAVDIFSLRGQTVVIISDGMGCGGRAAVDGCMTVGLTARLWKAGFDPDSVLRTVNAALMLKSREESLATLDIAVIDEFTGRLDSYKAGAACSLLYSGGRLSRLEQPSLPLGILPDVSFEHSHDRLAEGDILLLVSDGALTGGVAAVEELLGAHPVGETMPQLAKRIADAVRAGQDTHQDDISVIAIQMKRLKSTVRSPSAEAANTPAVMPG